MQPLKSLGWGICASSFVLGSVSCVLADAKANPYLSIVERNPFGLKDPPPPPVPQEEKPAPPPSKVVLTGITSLFGPTSKRCFVEITEQEPGKPAVVKRPILREGDRDGSVEVVSIDVEKNMVHIRNSGQELDLKFEDPTKSPSGGPHPVALGAPPAPTYAPPSMAAAASAPTIISPGFAENSARNSSVSMFSGQTAATSGANNSPSIPSAVGSSIGGGGSPYEPSIVSRNLRTPQSGAADPNIDVKQYVGLVAHEQSGGPPAPPTGDIDELRRLRKQQQQQQQGPIFSGQGR